MKRLALVAAIFAVAACSSKAKPAADTGAAMKEATPAPAMSDSSAMKSDTGMKMDSTMKKDTSMKAMDSKKKK
ncbi:MAG: hypothetical protein ACRENQ_06950 [Gemmatimonadaceae bacterium]